MVGVDGTYDLEGVLGFDGGAEFGAGGRREMGFAHAIQYLTEEEPR
jgi:hypothetical protein